MGQKGKAIAKYKGQFLLAQVEILATMQGGLSLGVKAKRKVPTSLWEHVRQGERTGLCN